MHSTENLKQSDDPHDVLEVASDVSLVAPTDEELSKLAKTLRHPSSPQTRAEPDLNAGPTVPPVDTTFRPAAVSDVPGRRRPMTTALLLAACAGVAGIAWKSYGDAAEQMIAPLVPQRVLNSLLAPEKPALPAQPAPPAVEAAAANAPPPPPAPLAQAAPEGVPPTTAALAPQSAPLLQSMARDLASVGQEVEQLRASIEQLKAGQQQMSREVARVSEQSLRPRILPQRSAAAPAHAPPSIPPRQATAAAPTLPPTAAPYVPRSPEEPQPQATPQPQANPEFASVPRPPMPVR